MEAGVIEHCESKIGGVCARTATWKQTIHAGRGNTGRVLMHSNWCDEHADRIAQKRRRDYLAPPEMARLIAEPDITSEPQPLT
jgi:hypothetical protein